MLAKVNVSDFLVFSIAVIDTFSRCAPEGIQIRRCRFVKRRNRNDLQKNGGRGIPKRQKIGEVQFDAHSVAEPRL